MKKHCAQCGKSWHGRRDTCPRCGSNQVYEAGGGWEKPTLIGVAVAIVVIVVALFATTNNYYWDDTNISAHVTSVVRQGPSEEYQGESLWEVTVEVSNVGNYDAWISLNYFSFYDDEDWWLTCEPNYTVYLADEDRQTWNEVWLPAGQSTVLTGILEIPDSAGELTMEYSSHSYSTERERDTISLSR